MKATHIANADTRIAPASKDNKATEVKRNADGSMQVTFGNGETGELSKDDADLQAFVIWTMLNSDCTK